MLTETELKTNTVIKDNAFLTTIADEIPSVDELSAEVLEEKAELEVKLKRLEMINKQLENKNKNFQEKKKELEEKAKELEAKKKELEQEVKSVKLQNKKQQVALSQQDALVQQQGPDGATYVLNKNSFLSVVGTPNPFRVLGAYPEIPESFYKPRYNITHFGLINEDDYCERVDMYNLLHPRNMFDEMNFFTDSSPLMTPRAKVMSKIGKIIMPHMLRSMPEPMYRSKLFQFNHKITSFYVNFDGFYRFHKIGQHFLCATQMFNHIPGHKSLVRKDEMINTLERYAKIFEGQPQCFNRSEVFPRAYRLHHKEECQEFFKLIRSRAYKESLATDPVQYLIKAGFGVHKSQGVFLLDEDKAKSLNLEYDYGKKCGTKRKSFLAQKYITNPLLLDKQNKFDFRIYMLIASTNPLIVYYHDGYMRVSLNSFDKSSKDRATHLTNTYLAEKKFAEARTENKTINGMTADELKDYHLWGMDDLLEYLLSTNKITDKNWLNNYLRPAFHKAIIHLVRMGSYTFLKESNVHELHGLDFMLDENLKLWFIECNPNPLLTGVKPELIVPMLKNMFTIQYSYYRSRMLRVLDLLYYLQQETLQQGTVDYAKWRAQYQAATRNRLEPRYKIKADNTWQLIMDENLLPSTAAYSDYVPQECIVDTN